MVDEPRRKSPLKLILRLTVIAAVVACLYFFIRNVDWAKLGDAFAHAKIWPLALAAALNFVCLYGKAACWHVMLAPRYVVKTVPLFRYTIAAFAASVIAPARAGELVRVWALKKHHGVPWSDGAAIAVTEKLLDAMSMLVVISPIPWLLPDLPGWVETSLALCVGVSLAIFLVLFVAVGRVKPESETWFARFIRGMHVLRAPRRLVLAFLALLLTWAADFAMVTLCLYAVGIDLPIGAGLLILFTLNLSIVVPSTPASVGALEVGALAATRLLHVPDEPALAFALIYHALQVVPLIVAGFALELRLVLGLEQQQDAAVAPAKS